VKESNLKKGRAHVSAHSVNRDARAWRKVKSTYLAILDTCNTGSGEREAEGVAVAGENEVINSIGIGKGGDEGGREKEQASQKLTHDGHSSGVWCEDTVRFALDQCQGNPEAYEIPRLTARELPWR